MIGWSCVNRYLEGPFRFKRISISVECNFFLLVWSVAGPMISARAKHTSSIAGTGYVLVAGGVISSGAVNTVEVYYPPSYSWVPNGQLSVARLSHAASRLIDGSVLLTGGSNGATDLSSVEFDNLIITNPTLAVAMQNARSQHASIVFNDGTTLVIGGHSSGPALASCELFGYCVDCMVNGRESPGRKIRSHRDIAFGWNSSRSWWSWF